jgi:hypothetical protein
MGKKEGSITGCILADFMGLGKNSPNFDTPLFITQN